MKNSVVATTKMRVISTAKGIQLDAPKDFSIIVKLMPGIDYPMDVLKAVVEATVREKYVEQFADQLKKDLQRKRQIGGIKWSVDVVGEIEITQQGE